MAIKFLLSMTHGFGPLLWVATALAFISWQPFAPDNFYNLTMGVILAIINILTALFTFYQERKAMTVLSGFTEMVPEDCLVIRGGVTVKVEASMLTVGDIVMLQTGKRVPADLRLISTTGLKLDKSMLTGEFEPSRASAAPGDASVSYLEATNIAFMGCNVVEGEGSGMVIAVGSNNQLAKIMQDISNQKEEKTTLQLEIDRVVAFIATFAGVTSLAIVLWWYFFLYAKHKSFMTMAAMIANNIGVVVAYCPDGLPLALSLGLAIIARRLCLTHSVMVKKLGTVETVGSISMLASDKTGTLTQNNMKVTGLLSAATVLNKHHAQENLPLVSDACIVTYTAIVAAMCNQAMLEEVAIDSPKPDGSVSTKLTKLAVGSNATDRALLNYGFNHHPSLPDAEVLLMMPFNSATKVQVVVVRYTATYDTYVLIKGAPEYVLKRCSKYLTPEGGEAAVDGAFLADLNIAIEESSNEGKRIVALAQFGPLSRTEYPRDFQFEYEPVANFPLTELTFTACAAISDPPKETSRGAVEDLRRAGILVTMVTGDAAPTAVAIARQVGIVTETDLDDMEMFVAPALAHDSKAIAPNEIEMTEVTYTDLERGTNPTIVADFASSRGNEPIHRAMLVTGKDLDSMTPEAWDFVFRHKEMVFARTTPEHKLMIVKEAQRRGHRVGVTGDGVNDSPALKCADVGIAMQNGSDVAKDAAAIVLLNDDLASVPQAVKEGRLIFENLRKVVAYLTSAGSWAEAIPMLATFFLGMPQPLSAFLMIIICCFTDVFGGLALMNELPEGDIMDRPPRDVKNMRLIDWKLLLYSYMFYANAMSIGAFYMFFHYMFYRGPHDLPNPVPVNDDGTRSFPMGYTPGQLLFAWNWAVNDNALGDDMIQAANVGSSIFFVALVVAQLGHVLSVRRKMPYFVEAVLGTKEYANDVRPWYLRVWSEILTIPQHIPWHIITAWVGSTVVAIIVVHGPLFNENCGTGPVPPLYWGMAFGFSLLWFVLGELRKWYIVLFPASWMAAVAW